MSDQASRIRWNSFYAFLSQLIRLLTNFLLFVGVARFYGAEVFGQFTTAQSIATIFLLFADFGFDSLLVTEVARHRERASELVRKYFSLKVIFALVATLAMVIVPVVSEFSTQTRLLVEIFSLYVFFSSLNNFFFAVFKSHEAFQHETKISFWINLILFALLVVLGLFKITIVAVAVVFVVMRCVGFVLSGKITKKIIGGRILVFKDFGWNDSWRDITIFGLYVVFGNLYFLLDTALISFLKGDVEVGVYQSVFKLILIAMVLQDIATTTMTPVLSRLHRSDYGKWQEIGKLLNKTLFFISLPIASICLVYADQIVAFIYGAHAFAAAVPILRVFTLVVLFRYSSEAYGLMLTTSLRHSVRLRIVIFATLLNICANLVLIPKFGIMGAAWAAVLTNFIVLTCYAITSRCPYTKWTFEFRNILMITFVGVMSAILWSYVSLTMWIGGLIIVVTYSFGVVFVGFSKWELSMIFRGRKGSLMIQSSGT